MFFLHFINNIFQNICWWLLLLIKPWKMKSLMIPVFSFVINFCNKTMLVKQKVIIIFKKNVKAYLQNKKKYLMLPSSHGHFNPMLILPVKMTDLPQQHVNTVYWL